MIWLHASPVTDLRMKHPSFEDVIPGPKSGGHHSHCHLCKRDPWSWAVHSLSCCTWQPWGQINSCLHRWSVLLPTYSRKNESFLWLAALKQKSLLLADASPCKPEESIYLHVQSFNGYLLSTSTVLSADFYQKTPYLVTQRNI